MAQNRLSLLTPLLLCSLALPEACVTASGQAPQASSSENPKITLRTVLVFTADFCATQKRVNVFGPTSPDSVFEVGKAACEQLEPALKDVFPNLVRAQTPPSPGKADLVLVPEFVDISTTVPTSSKAEHELDVLVKWTATDSSGKRVWLQTETGSAHRTPGRANAFGGMNGIMQVMSEYARLIVQDALQDLAGKSASAMATSPVLRNLDRRVAEAAAQVPAPTPTDVTDAAPTRFKLVEGTNVALVFDQNISSKNASAGTPVTFSLVEDLKVGAVVVAKAGCKAQGEVTLSKSQVQTIGGPPGELDLRIEFLIVGALRVPLRGETRVIGTPPGMGSSMGSAYSLGLAGRHSHEAEIKKGASFEAHVADDISLPPAI